MYCRHRVSQSESHIGKETLNILDEFLSSKDIVTTESKANLVRFALKDFQFIYKNPDASKVVLLLWGLQVIQVVRSREAHSNLILFLAFLQSTSRQLWELPFITDSMSVAWRYVLLR